MILYEYTHEYASVQGREGGMSIFARKARRFRSVIRAHLYSYIRRISCLSSARHQSGRSLDAFIHWHSLSVRLSTLRRQPQVYSKAARGFVFLAALAAAQRQGIATHFLPLRHTSWSNITVPPCENQTQAEVRAKCTAGSFASRRVWNNILRHVAL